MGLYNFIYNLLPNKGRYLESSVGEINLIISAPHGGKLKPFLFPSRKYGIRVADSFTYELSEKLVSFFFSKPYYIFSKIHRSKVDLNRGFNEATEGYSSASDLWYNWIGFITTSIYKIKKRYGKCLFIDIHSHNNGDEFHLGYNLSPYHYLDVMQKKFYHKNSTISSTSLTDLHAKLFGEFSIASSMMEYGYKIHVPTPSQQYFNGGFNMEFAKEHGSDSIQIECPVSVLERNLDDVVFSLFLSIEKFRKRYYR